MRNFLIRALIALSVILPITTNAGTANQAGQCHGQFPNLVTDICWDCAFPIKLFGAPTISAGNQEDYDTGVPNLCSCNGPLGVPIAGFHTAFWEYTRQIDVTKTPYCMVSLGTEMDMGINDSLNGSDTPGSETIEAVNHTTFRQVHWYINPAMGLMQIMLDSKCLDTTPFDIAYISEVDPTHSNDDLANLFAPEDYLFGNIVAELACTADCVQSSIGFGSNLLYWCSGCNGYVFPLGGFVHSVYSGVQMSSVMVHRLTAKMHRMLTQYSTAGQAGMCGQGQLQITMDKREYKYTMLYPNPQSNGDITPKYNGSTYNLDPNAGNAGSTSNSTNSAQGSQAQQSSYGRCCQPFGRTTILWGAGREFPAPGGDDFAYGLFRKRDCCQ